MKLIDSFYKTKNLAKNGVFLLISAFLLLALSDYIIPEFKVKKVDKQIVNLFGYTTKFDDRTEVSHFIASIKKNGGYLCLGTSESTSIPTGNYFDFLNNDPDIPKTRFSIMSGAGRTCSIHIPMLLRHREEVDSLKIIYLINPVYWRTSLSEIYEEYLDRYTNYYMSNSIPQTDIERKTYCPAIDPYLDNVPLFNKLLFTTEYFIRAKRRNYFYNLNYLINPDAYEESVSYMPYNRRDLTRYPLFGQIDSDYIDTVVNLASDAHPYHYDPINESSTYRYEELKSFMAVCKDLGVQVTYIIGPYNARFLKNHEPEGLPAYVRTTQKIKQILLDGNADFIDATDISSKPGAFIDHQHHSSYGAYFIYSKIKMHLHEKSDL
ncbi:MAG: hypothetical protein JKY09_07990 [Crocinitomicaceae bacterium]|nr:hypothetical protein [Crocinitomicaceae bacterium]